MNIAVIPARGGSTRIPKKNIKEFAGKPIISYPIETALKSELFDQVIVSTDSEEIAEVSIQAGAQVPFLRPSELGENEVNLADVVHHTLSELVNRGVQFDYSCCILATAPFLKVETLRKGYEEILENDADSVVSVTRFSFPVLRALKLDDNSRLRFMWPEHELTHSNHLPEAYHDAAQFYWLNTKKFLSSKSLVGREVLPVFLPNYLVKDIDTDEDWTTAEIMYDSCLRKGLL
jgi:pseudaminic acid cytidylyltransferase